MLNFRYIEEYPDGYYNGKLFVFDNRFTIEGEGSVNKKTISSCLYCSEPYDSYEVCSSKFCSQLVIICQRCRMVGKSTCCTVCYDNDVKKLKVEECTCTRKRKRIPKETNLE